MARSNTPSSYKCSSCGIVGHNVRACPSRPAEELSATARLRLERAERKTARLAVKAEKEAAKAEKAAAKAPYVAVAEPVIVIKPFLAEPVVDEVVSETVVEVSAADEVDTSAALAADPDLAALLASIGVDAA